MRITQIFFKIMHFKEKSNLGEGFPSVIWILFSIKRNQLYLTKHVDLLKPKYFNG